MDRDVGVAAPRDALDAERRPLVTYSGGVDEAWAAKIEGDILPAQPRSRSRVPMATAALASLLFIAAFLGGREGAVAALPDLAGLYGSLGWPVNLDGLAIRDVRAERSDAAGAGRISVRGRIVNENAAERSIPPIEAMFQDAGLTSVGGHSFDPSGRILAPGEAAQFTLEVDGVPQGAVRVVLRFRGAWEPGLPDAAPAGAQP